MSKKKKKSYPARIPRPVSGIRLQLHRSSGCRSWWAKKWFEAVEALGIAGRSARARNYAISGQVTEVTIDSSSVTAKVVGGRRDAYEVGIAFRPLPDDAKRAILGQLREEPMLIARLLNGELPLEVETMFGKAGFPLFPGVKLGDRIYDVTTHCSCPDWANPCKHSLAVLMLLGEEAEFRPLILLELRGIREAELYDKD